MQTPAYRTSLPGHSGKIAAIRSCWAGKEIAGPLEQPFRPFARPDMKGFGEPSHLSPALREEFDGR